MHFEIVGEITQVETFATSSGIREATRLRKTYGLDAGERGKASPKFG